MNEKLMRAVGLDKEMDLVAVGKCPFCKQVVSIADFKDALSKKEYLISGLCQKCQDDFFSSEGDKP